MGDQRTLKEVDTRASETIPVVKVSSGVLGGRPEPTVFGGPYAVTSAWLQSRLHLPPHAHEHATLNVVLDGEYRETMEGGALQSHGPATLIAKPAGTVHGNQLGSAPAECLVIELRPDTVAALRDSVPQFFDEGFVARLVCVDTSQLDGAFAGRVFDAALLEDLPATVDPCGERGEFHTFVSEGPPFGGAIAYQIGETVLRDNRFMYCDIG